jgi:hypothetical protein
VISSQKNKFKSRKNKEDISYYNPIGAYISLSFLALSLMYHFGWVGDKKLFKDQVSFVVDIGLLNLVHISLTIVALLLLSEFKRWFKLTHNKISIIIITLPLFFFLYRYIYFVQSDILWRISWVSIRCIGLHHAAMQTYGILLLAGKINNAWKLKKYFYLISAAYVLALFTFEFAAKDIRPLLVNLSTIISSMSVLSILYASRFNYPELKFLSRLILYPVGTISPIAGMGISAIHGTEYALVFNKIVDNKNKQENRGWYNVIFAAVILVFSLLCFFSLRDSSLVLWNNKISDRSIPFYLVGVWILIDYINIVHYYFDWRLFRLKNKVSRDYILPLIK